MRMRQAVRSATVGRALGLDKRGRSLSDGGNPRSSGMRHMRFEGTSAYVATDDLKVAVNAAITLERPLLVKGEVGTGKTVLALEIAKSLGDSHARHAQMSGEPWEPGRPNARKSRAGPVHTTSSRLHELANRSRKSLAVVARQRTRIRACD